MTFKKNIIGMSTLDPQPKAGRRPLFCRLFKYAKIKLKSSDPLIEWRETMESVGDLLGALPNIQLHFYCEDCQRRYMKGWIQVNPSLCLFCRTARSMDGAPSRLDLLMEAEWIYLQTGREDQWAFYTEYIVQVHRWSDALSIPYTHEDTVYQKLLMASVEDVSMTD